MPGWRSEEERNTFNKTLEREGEAYMDSTITEKKYLTWMQPDGYSTMRFVVDPGQILYTQAKDSYMEDDNCDITHPDSLAAFIRWAARQCPARKYVLVLADHGRAYQPHEEVGPDETCIKRHPRHSSTTWGMTNGISRSSRSARAYAAPVCGSMLSISTAA